MSIVQTNPLEESARQALSILDRTPLGKGSNSSSLTDLFDRAIRSDADIVVILGRRCFTLYWFLTLAGRLSFDPSSTSGRVLSQRAAERDRSALEGKNVLVVDDTVRTGRTLAKYLSRFQDARPAQLSALVLGSAQSDIEKAIATHHDEHPVDVNALTDISSIYDTLSKDSEATFAFDAAEAIEVSSVTPFCDFPLYRAVAPEGALGPLNRLLDALTAGTNAEWQLSEIARGASRIRNLVLSKKSAQIRFRITLEFDADDNLISLLFMPKITEISPTEIKGEDWIAVAKAESAHRDTMFRQSIGAFNEFAQERLDLVAPLYLEPHPMPVRHHWPRSRWQQVVVEMMAPIDRAESTEDWEIPSIGIEGAVPLDRNVDCIVDVFEKIVDAKGVDGSVAGRTIEQLDESLDHSRDEIRLALDWLHDASYCLPRLLPSADRYAIVRLWTTGEGGASSDPDEVRERCSRSKPGSLEIPAGTAPLVELLKRWSFGDETHRNLVRTGRLVGALNADQELGLMPEQLEDGQPISGLQEAMEALPLWIRCNPVEAARWFQTSRPTLSGISPIAALRDSRLFEVMSLARVAPR